PIPDGHHVDAPCRCGLAVEAHQDRKGLAPGGLDGPRPTGADQDIGVNASDLDGRGEFDAHGYRRPRTASRATRLVPPGSGMPANPVPAPTNTRSRPDRFAGRRLSPGPVLRSL